MKLYVYPNARTHVHDLDPGFENLVPFSQEGIDECCEVVGPIEADYFYMGQVSDGVGMPPKSDFQYFDAAPNKHIIDIEGDTSKLEIWLQEAILTINSAPQYLKSIHKNLHFKNLFIRPTFSTVLIDTIMKDVGQPNIYEERPYCFSFIGLRDYLGVREKLGEIVGFLKRPDTLYIINAHWMGKTEPNGEIANTYKKVLSETTFALCPRGQGHDSARFIESLYFGCIPVVYGDNLLPGYGYYDTSFIPQISPSIAVNGCYQELYKLASMKSPERYVLWQKCQNYLNDIIRPYFANPTKFIIERFKL